MAQRRRWSDEGLATAVATSPSVRAVLQKLALHPTGANYKAIYRHVARLGLDTSHFLGQAHLRGKQHSWGARIALEAILVANSSYTNLRRLKNRLRQRGLIEDRCHECGLTEWRGRPLALVLDHINGLNDDHRLENLRLLCPNCHSQTPTFAGRNVGRRRKTQTDLEAIRSTEPMAGSSALSPRTP